MAVRGVKRVEVLRRACRDHSIELAGPRLCSAVDVGELMWDWLTAAAAGFVEIGAAGPEGAGPVRGGLVPAARPAVGAERLGLGRCCRSAGWEGALRAMGPGAGSPRSRQRGRRRHGRRRGWCARPAGARWERSWRVSVPIRATSVRKIVGTAGFEP